MWFRPDSVHRVHAGTLRTFGQTHTPGNRGRVLQPESAPKFDANSTLFAGWLTEQARAFHGQRWDAYAAAGGAPAPGAPVARRCPHRVSLLTVSSPASVSLPQVRTV